MDPNQVVLIVEDDPLTCTGTRRVLERNGYAVLTAATGAEALAVLSSRRPLHAVILDLHLPDLSGLELCRAFRAVHSASELPILFLSSDSDIPQRSEGLRAGASDYLSKPVNPSELVLRLGAYLDLIQRTHTLTQVQRDWQQTFDALTDAVMLLDAEGRILRCNAAMGRLLHTPAESVIGQHCYNVIHKAEQRIEMCPFARMFKTRAPESSQLELDGRWVEVTVEPLWDDAGGIRGAVHRLRDIHDRITAEQANQALYLSERRWRTMAEVRTKMAEAALSASLFDFLSIVLEEVTAQMNSPIGCCHFYDEASGTFTLKHGYSRLSQAPIGPNEEDRQAFSDICGIWMDCLKARRPIIHNDCASCGEAHGIHKDPSESTRELAVPVFRSGRIVAMMGVERKTEPYQQQDVDTLQHLADLTWDLVERKRLVTQHAEEEAKFKAIFQLSPDGLFLLRREPPTFLEVNPCFAHMLGFLPEEMVGRSAMDLQLWVALEERAKMMALLQEQGRVQALEIRLKHKEGRILWVALTLEPVVLNGVGSLLGTVRDISERKALEAETHATQANLDALFRSTGDFVWSVDSQDRLVVFNEPLGDYFQQFLGLRPWKGAQPEDGLPEERAKLWHALYACCRAEGALETEYPASNGRIFRYSVNPVHYQDGSVGVSVFGRDVTAFRETEEALRRTNRALRAISACERVILHATNETVMLQEVCEQIVKLGGYRMAWAGYCMQDETLSVRPVASSGDTDGYLQGIQISWADNAHGWGPVGIAIREKRPAAQDTLDDAGFDPWREAARRSGFRSALAIPLCPGMDPGCLGALVVYSSERDAFDADEIQLVESLTASVSFGIKGLRDRSARLEVERQLMSSEQRLRAIFETTADGIVLLDKQTLAIVDANPAFCQTYGYTREELLSLKATDMSAEPDQTAKATREPVSRVRGRLHKKKDGSVFPVDLTAGAFEEQGRIISVVSSRDISASVQAARDLELALWESERLRRALDAVPVHVYIKDMDSRYMYGNQATLDLFQRTAETIKGASDRDFFPEEVAATLRQVDLLVFGGQETSEEIIVPNPDGSRQVYLEVKSPLYSDDDAHQCIGLLGVSTDITARKNAEDALARLSHELEKRVQQRTTQLQATNQELEAFSYSVSHDLRAPLRAIMGFSEAMEEDCSACLDPQAKGYLDRIQKAGQRMGSLIDDLLRLSRVTRQNCHTETVDLSALAEDVCIALAQRHPEHAVRWHVEPGLTCTGDDSLLRIVFENILGNAWKFTAKSNAPRVDVECSAPGAIRIRDNGAGFPQEKADQLFVPFRRLHHEGEFAGTGLGLAIVRRIMARHQGSVIAEGTPGQGACFTLCFPQP